MSKIPPTHQAFLAYLRDLAQGVIADGSLQTQWNAAHQNFAKPGMRPPAVALRRPSDLWYGNGLILDQHGSLVYDCTGSPWTFANEAADRAELIATLVDNQLNRIECSVTLRGAIANLTVARMEAACARLHVDPAEYADPAIIEALKTVGAIIAAQTSERVSLAVTSRPRQGLADFTFRIAASKEPVASYLPIGGHGEVFVWKQSKNAAKPSLLEQGYDPSDTAGISRVVARRLKALDAA